MSGPDKVMSGPDVQKKRVSGPDVRLSGPDKTNKNLSSPGKVFFPGFEQVSLILAKSVGTRQNLSELESFVST